jgi:hypothetical protein
MSDCKYCGKTGLNWQHDGDAWVLMEGKYRVHVCNEVAAQQNTMDDFEALERKEE